MIKQEGHKDVQLQKLREALERSGFNASAWARDHGFKPGQVHDVLRGKAIGRRGASHRIAVALGIKPGELSRATTGER